MLIDAIKSLAAKRPSMVKGKTFLHIATINAIGIWWYSIINGKPIDGSIPTMYGIIVGAYTASKISEHSKEKSDDSPPADGN